MSKLFWASFGIFLTLSLIFLTPNVKASSSSVVISEIMTGSNTNASQEFIELNNLSNSPLDIKGWSIEYKSATGTKWISLSVLDGLLPSRDFVLLASNQNPRWIDSNFYFSPGLAATGGHIRLVDKIGNIVDTVGWGTADSAETAAATVPPAGQSISRKLDANGYFIDTDNNNLDFEISAMSNPHMGALEDNATADCPDNQSLDNQGKCQTDPPQVVPCDNQVYMSEFLTDPLGLEADGGEFIELYNPSDKSASLSGCHLKSNKSSSDLVTFSDQDVIPPKSYFVIQLVNKLTNASGSIEFITANNDQNVSYQGVKEGQSNILVGDTWQVTDQPTAGADNLIMSVLELADDPSDQANCPAGKYRNPETNRCKNIDDPTSQLTPCAPDQERNPETNRCRKIDSTSSTLTPCQPGQERNPDTNRCRKATDSTSSLVPCEPGQERNPDTNRCRKVTNSDSAISNLSKPAATNPSNFNSKIVLAVASGALGYGGWEYKSELVAAWRKLLSLLSK